MKLYIGIKDGKVYDISSNLVVRRNDMIAREDYLYIEVDKDIRVDDTWDSQNNISLKDAPSRLIPPPMSREEMITKVEYLETQLSRIDDLETENIDLKDRLTTIEGK